MASVKSIITPLRRGETPVRMETERKPKGGKGKSRPSKRGLAEADKEPGERNAPKRKGNNAMKAIRAAQRGKGAKRLVFRKLPFSRLARLLMIRYAAMTNREIHTPRIKSSALEALQAGTEQYLRDLLELGNDLTVHAHRVGLTNADLAFARRLVDQAC